MLTAGKDPGQANLGYLHLFCIAHSRNELKAKRALRSPYKEAKKFSIFIVSGLVCHFEVACPDVSEKFRARALGTCRLSDLNTVAMLAKLISNN